MAKLFECKGCGNKISKKAKSCPKCGEPNIRTHWFTWLVLILFIFFLKSITSSASSSISNSENSYTQPKQIKSQKNIYYVVSNELNVRLEADKTSKITNILYKGQKLNVFEIKNEWARISQYYDGKIEGISKNVARWVSLKYLSQNYPSKKKTNDNIPIINALKSSDNFDKYQSIFISASKNLINSNRCTLKDFERIGGWMKSNTNYKYFTYCGELQIENKIYLDILTGKIIN